MDTLMTPCIFCGGDRPLASELCPHCGHGWIDSRVSDAVRGEPTPDPADRDAPPQAPAEPPLPDTSADGAPAAGGHEADTGPRGDQPVAEAPAAPPAAVFHTDAAATGWEAGASVVFEASITDPRTTSTAATATDAEAAAPRDTSEAAAVAPPAAEPTPTPGESTAAAEGPVPAGPTEGSEGAPPMPPPVPDEAPPDVQPAPAASPENDWPEPQAGDPGALSVFPAVTPPAAIPPQRPGAEPPEPVAAAAGDASPEPPATIDPDRLIDSVFDDSFFDEPDPRAASDDMLDDEDAWSAFTAGSLDPAPPAQGAPAPASPAPAARAGADTEGSVPPPPPGPEAVERIYPSTMGEFRGEHPDDSDFFSDEAVAAAARRGRWSQRVIVALIIAGIIGAWFVVIAWITQDEGDTTVTPTTLPDVVSTVPPTQVTTTTAIPTTTTSTTTTTTTTTTTLPIFEATGDPIATEDLSLQAEAMGVLSFGTIEGFGRLVATFGQPDARFGADASWGICEDDIGFVAQWGPLSGIFIGSDDLSTFEGYRLVNAEPDHPASVLATLSGVRVGDTVADLEETYGERFTIVYEEINGVPSFILLGSSDATLLWGPLSSTESDGFVDGINSPVPCDGGPAPSS